MNFSQVLYCNGVNKIAVEDIVQKCTHQRIIENFLNFLKNWHKNIKKFSKIFQKELIEFKKINKFKTIQQNF